MVMWFDSPPPPNPPIAVQHLVFVDLPPAAFVKEERLLMFPAGGSAESVFSLRNMCQRLDVCRRKAAWEKQAFGVTMFDRRRRATESTPSAEGTFKKRKNNNSRQKSETEKKTVFRFYHFCHEGKKKPQKYFLVFRGNSQMVLLHVAEQK